ncbi:MAG: hypothetical protein NXI04_08085 [Planctomycetaceae bacterium]|nr:hypothetical protein [Planctomycetaceae bacterium]
MNSDSTNSIEIPEVALIAFDALQSGDARTVAVVVPFQQRRQKIKVSLRQLLPTWKVRVGMPPRCTYRAAPAGDSTSWYSVTPRKSMRADLVLRDDAPPTWQQEALVYVADCEPDGSGPCRETRNTPHPWTQCEFQEWFNTIAHTTAWPATDSLPPGIPSAD